MVYFREADDRVLVLEGNKDTELVGSSWKQELASSGK